MAVRAAQELLACLSAEGCTHVLAWVARCLQASLQSTFDFCKTLLRLTPALLAEAWTHVPACCLCKLRFHDAGGCVCTPLLSA